MGKIERPRVQYNDLREYLGLLDKAGLLTHITAPADLKHKIGAICTRDMERHGPGLVFDNIKGYEGKPLVSNIIYSVEQLAIAFNTDPDPDKIYTIIVDGHKNRLPSVKVNSGPCKEVKCFGNDVDVTEIPTPVWHELDGGPYLGTSAGVITRDPDTGILNMGTYRAMVVDKDTLTVSGQLIRDVVRNDKKGQPTPIAIVMGMDPLLTLASGSPVHVDEEGNMEYEAAGAWRGSPTELVKCETNDLLVPAQAEYIIEGEIAIGARMKEGPHGEAGGFYGQNLAAFPMKVSCVTHRKDPITYGIICLLEEDYPRWLFRSGAFQDRLMAEKGMECVREAYYPELGGRGWGGAIIAAKIEDPDAPRRIIEATWRINSNRWVIVVDEDCDLRNWNDVMWRVVTAVRNGEDIYKGKATNRGEISEQPRNPRAAEMDIDSDIPDPTGMNASLKFKFKHLPPINMSSREYMAKIAGRWGEFGLP